jgi:hypothetical protein
LENSLADVNTHFKNILEEEQVGGPVLLLAIQNGHLEMLQMLVEKFSANVNQQVYVEEKPSTLLIFAMKCNNRYMIFILSFQFLILCITIKV